MVKTYKHDLKAIIDLFKEKKTWMSIKEVSNILKINRNATAKYLDILAYEGKLLTKDKGPAKLYRIVEELPNAVHVSEIYDDSGILIVDEDLKIVYMNSYFIKQFNLDEQLVKTLLFSDFFKILKFDNFKTLSNATLFDTFTKLLKIAKTKELKQKEYISLQSFLITLIPIQFNTKKVGVLFSFRSKNSLILFCLRLISSYLELQQIPFAITDSNHNLLFSNKQFNELLGINFTPTNENKELIKIYSVFKTIEEQTNVRIAFESLKTPNSKIELLINKYSLEIYCVEINPILKETIFIMIVKINDKST
ncbi:MAG: PAS domain-containing protein [Candidatus Aenigmatarchaeota archaeon]